MSPFVSWKGKKAYLRLVLNVILEDFYNHFISKQF